MLFRNLKHLVIIILCACFISSCNQSISYKRPQLLANFGSFECNTNKLSNVNYSNIWNKIRNGFCLDTVHSPRIDKEIKWFMNNKAFLYRSIERAKPYLYHVVRELEKNNLPFDLISDEDKSVHKLFGTWVEKKMYGKTYMGTSRKTFLIDENRVIKNTFNPSEKLK